MVRLFHLLLVAALALPCFASDINVVRPFDIRAQSRDRALI